MSLIPFLLAAILLAIARTARAKLITRLSGITMIGIGAFLALARRES